MERYRHNQGFSWIEVGVFMPLLLIVVVAVSSLATNGITWMRMNALDNMARAAAILELEQLRTLKWGGADGITGMAPATNVTANLPVVLQNLGATGTVTMSPYDVNGDGVLDAQDTARQVTVTVSGYGTPRGAVSLTTLLSQNELH